MITTNSEATPAGPGVRAPGGGRFNSPSLITERKSPLMTLQPKQALCCTCGNLRNCLRPRNHRRENYWLSGPVDRGWHRETGDLKCSECGRVTRHALIMPEGDVFRDHAERVTRIALGSTADPVATEDLRESIRKAYRQGRRPNPNMRHLWSAADEETARKAGKTTVVTRCGETQEIPPKSDTFAAEGQLRPDAVRWEECEDPDTGMWWIEVDCPDCYRVSNERRRVKRRKDLKLLLTCALIHWDDPRRLPDVHVEDLVAALKEAQVLDGCAGDD